MSCDHMDTLGTRGYKNELFSNTVYNDNIHLFLIYKALLLLHIQCIEYFETIKATKIKKKN